MKTRLSHSSVSTYQSCGEKYRLSYVEKLRSAYGKSSLLFGVAVDEAENVLLLTRDLAAAKKEFIKHWTQGIINKETHDLESSEIIKYSKADFDPDLGDTPWESLLEKGLMFLEEYHRSILPKIKEIIFVQKTVEIDNGEGDIIVCKLDMACVWEDGKRYLIDNKTTSQKYKADSAEDAQQLLLYFYAVKDEYKLDGVGYIVIDKTIEKTKVMSCMNGCNTEHRSNRLKNCPGCKSVMEPTDLEFKVNIQVILNDNPNTETMEKVIRDFDSANEGISNQIYKKNLNACWEYGGCDYKDLCHKGKMSGLVDMKDKK